MGRQPPRVFNSNYLFTSHADVEKPGKVRAIFTLMNKPSNKLWLLFLSNVLPVFDRFNVLFQTSSTSTVHRLHWESVRLLKTVLGFFIKADIIRSHSDDLTMLDIDDTTNHLPNEEIFLGDSTTALFIDLNENDGEALSGFYHGAVSFFQRFVQKQIQKFDFKSDVLHILSFLDPAKSQLAKPGVFDRIRDCLPLSFDKAAVKLEHREFVSDSSIDTRVTDAVSFWVAALNMKSPMGDHKYEKLATTALTLLSIPTSNADCERAFSHVRRIKSEFRSSLSTETTSSLIGCRFNKTSLCCEQTVFKESLLLKAKKCTHQRNLSFKKGQSDS